MRIKIEGRAPLANVIGNGVNVVRIASPCEPEAMALASGGRSRRSRDARRVQTEPSVKKEAIACYHPRSLGTLGVDP